MGPVLFPESQQTSYSLTCAPLSSSRYLIPIVIDVDVEEMKKGFIGLLGFPETMMNSAGDQAENPIVFYAQYHIQQYLPLKSNPSLIVYYKSNVQLFGEPMTVVNPFPSYKSIYSS